MSQIGIHGNILQTSPTDIINLDRTARLVYNNAEQKLVAESYGTNKSVRLNGLDAHKVLTKLEQDGAFVEIPSSTTSTSRLFSTKALHYITYDHDKEKMVFFISGKKHKIKVSQEDANQVLKTVAKNTHFQSIGNALVNINKVTTLSFGKPKEKKLDVYNLDFDPSIHDDKEISTQKTLKRQKVTVTFMGGNKLSQHVSAIFADELKDEISQKYSQFTQISGNLYNRVLAGNVWLKNKLSFTGTRDLMIHYPGAHHDIEITLPSSQADKAIESFEGHVPFFSIENDKMNPMVSSRVHLRKPKFWVEHKGLRNIFDHYLGLSRPSVSFNVASHDVGCHQSMGKLQEFMLELSGEPYMVRIGGELLNIHSVAALRYDKTTQTLSYKQGQIQEAIAMSPDEAALVISDITTNNPQFIQMKQTLINADFVGQANYVSRATTGEMGYLNILLGNETLKITMLEEHAKSFLGKISSYGQEMGQARPDLIQSQFAGNKVLYDAFNEIDRMHAAAMPKLPKKKKGKKLTASLSH